MNRSVRLTSVGKSGSPAVHRCTFALVVLSALAVPVIVGCQSAAAAQFVQAEKERVAAPIVEAADLAQLVVGNSAFAFDFYHAVRAEKGNLFYSPYSLSLALAMTYGGTRNQTERQMADTLHFTLPRDRLHPAVNGLDLELASRNTESFRLSIANATWGQKGFTFLPEYLDLLAEHYGAGLRLLDFENASEDARLTINDWVSDQTEGKIEDLLPEGSITELTRLVLTNAIYFKGKWEYPFDKNSTRDGPFHLLDGSQATVPMMTRRADFRVAEGEGYLAVELPYEGNKMAMVVLLPSSGRFEGFEATLTTERLDEVLRTFQESDIQLTMPKFAYESSFSLKQTLTEMGMSDAFDPRLADLSGMNGADCSSGDVDCLYITHVAHKAFVAVDEEGTEAAAASGVVLAVESMPRQVTVDRPFIFLIRDLETGAILFVGRVLNPKA